jgi:hypothetical protein
VQSESLGERGTACRRGPSIRPRACAALGGRLAPNLALIAEDSLISSVSGLNPAAAAAAASFSPHR